CEALAVAASGGSDVTVWSRPGETPPRVVRYPGEGYCLALSRDGMLLAIGGMANDPEIWGVTANPPRQVESPQRERPLTAIFRLAWGGPKGRHLVGTANGTATVWDVSTGKGSYLSGFEGMASDLSFDRAGRHLAAAFSTGVRVWKFRGN